MYYSTAGSIKQAMQMVTEYQQEHQLDYDGNIQAMLMFAVSGYVQMVEAFTKLNIPADIRSAIRQAEKALKEHGVGKGDGGFRYVQHQIE